MNTKQKILPSIMAKNQKELNVDFNNLKGIVKHLHLDIVDGEFAKNKVFQFPFRLNSNFEYSVHLMIKKPEQWIQKNLHKKSIKLFIPQFEEIKQPLSYIKWMKKNKQIIAFAIKPETQVSSIKPYLKDTHIILILTVHPGFYGSKYLPSNLKKVQQVKEINSKIKVIIDGGMHPKTIGKASQSGADFFISGSYTTKSDNPKKAIKELKTAMITL